MESGFDEHELAAISRECIPGTPPWQISRVPRGYETVLSHEGERFAGTMPVHRIRLGPVL
ncbi:hypothetical protein J4G37_14695 [Microvirga sp. 3-52]|nr:hypothetical protein [Microvirga sp. 3-52]